MSYEGHVQILCQNNHLSEMAEPYGYFEYPFKDWRCKAHLGMRMGKLMPCNAPTKIINSVDDTNCDSYGYRKAVKLTEEIRETCSLNCSHVVADATYSLSEEKYFWDGLTNEWRRCDDVRTFPSLNP